MKKIYIKTYGCQMNVYDSERMYELMEPHGYTVTNEYNDADLVIGAVLIPGAKAPKIITKKMLRLIKPKAVLVDVSIDQGGCFETSRVTTHENPTFVEQNIIHYCVPNMPGAVANTATYALTNVTCAAIIGLANQGLKAALKKDKYLLKGLNIHEGKVTHQAVATAHNYKYFDPIVIFS